MIKITSTVKERLYKHFKLFSFYKVKNKINILSHGRGHFIYAQSLSTLKVVVLDNIWQSGLLKEIRMRWLKRKCRNVSTCNWKWEWRTTELNIYEICGISSYKANATSYIHTISGAKALCHKFVLVTHNFTHFVA